MTPDQAHEWAADAENDKLAELYGHVCPECGEPVGTCLCWQEGE